MYIAVQPCAPPREIRLERFSASGPHRMWMWIGNCIDGGTCSGCSVFISEKIFQNLVFYLREYIVSKPCVALRPPAGNPPSEIQGKWSTPDVDVDRKLHGRRRLLRVCVFVSIYI